MEEGRGDIQYTLTKVKVSVVSSDVKRSPFQAPFVAQVFRHTSKCQENVELQLQPHLLIMGEKKEGGKMLALGVDTAQAGVSCLFWRLFSKKSDVKSLQKGLLTFKQMYTSFK